MPNGEALSFAVLALLAPVVASVMTLIPHEGSFRSAPVPAALERGSDVGTDGFTLAVDATLPRSIRSLAECPY